MVETVAATRLLARIREGDENAAADLMPLVYEELRTLAGRWFRHQPPSHTLQPTALVHEAFLRMVDRTGTDWKDRAHFCAVCAVAMRGILADHARRRRAAKRGGDWKRVTLTGTPAESGVDAIDALALDEALGRLAERSERQARLVEYRFFGGLSVEEAAAMLDVSAPTAERDWRMARAWLSAELAGDGAP